MNDILKLNLDYSKVTTEERKAIDSKVAEIHESIKNKTSLGSEFMDWISWPSDYNKEELNEIVSKANWMKQQGVETLLVVGIGGSFLGAQSAIDFVNGKMNSQEEVIFAGINMSSSHIKQIEKKLQNKKWALCVISKSGTTLEPALAFRHFKSILEKNLGKEEASKYIVAITDSEKGALKPLADKKGYTTFVVPDGIGGRFSGLTPVGTFPMAFAGIDTVKMIEGAKKAMDDFSNLENNLAYEYAATRFILNNEKSKSIEFFSTYDFDLDMTSEWFKQLFGESEGKDGKGIIPSSVSYSRDLHSMGQIIQDGPKTFFETTLWIEEDKDQVEIKEDSDNLDGLNYLSGMSLHEINKKAFEGVLKAHYEEGETPNIVISLKDKSEYSLGYLWHFFFISVTMSGYLLGVNPFDQPGVELYKKNMFDNLKK